MRACQDRGWDNIGVMETDWNDKGPDAFRARRELYNACNGRIFTFDGKAFIVEDKSDYMKLGSQSAHHDYCKATDSIVHAEEDDGLIIVCNKLQLLKYSYSTCSASVDVCSNLTVLKWRTASW